MKTAKVFRNGQSQAVRLPKEFRFKDAHVYVKQTGNVVNLIPASSFWDSLIEGLSMFSGDFMNERSQPAVQSREDPK
ncbi:MAG: antitoxin [Deltaproteobacteria bacterium]|nr:antitoxin [Deltaproteobacteria bacterium]